MARAISNVSLTDFLEFVRKAGPPKVTVVQNFKNRGDYDPQTDFYKGLRERMVTTLRGGRSAQDLVAWTRNAHAKKRAAYREAATGFAKFVARKQLTWFEPPRENLQIGSLVLNVNPEFGLEIGGVPHAIKLHLKEETLPKNRAQLILHVLNKAFASKRTLVSAVLDVRKGRLHTSAPTKGIDALLAGEAASFATMFNAL